MKIGYYSFVTILFYLCLIFQADWLEIGYNMKEYREGGVYNENNQ